MDNALENGILAESKFKEIGAVRRGENILVQGVCNSGKSRIAFDIAREVIKSGKKVLFLTDELTPNNVYHKLQLGVEEKPANGQLTIFTSNVASQLKGLSYEELTSFTAVIIDGVYPLRDLGESHEENIIRLQEISRVTKALTVYTMQIPYTSVDEVKNTLSITRTEVKVHTEAYTVTLPRPESQLDY